MRRLGAFDGAARGPRAGAGARPGGPAPGGFDTGGIEFGDLGGLGDIFSSIFGRGARREEPRAEALETVVEVPFRVAMLGGRVPVTLSVTEPCPTCAGSGGAPGATWSTCPECNGRGTISFGQGGFAVNRPCPQCRGRGRIPSQPCPTCRGAGEVRTERRVMITVPPATETGSRVRLRGQGQSVASGSPPGDLIITFQVQPDRFFRREGLDLIAPVPINIAQATLGSKVSVRTLDGKKIAVRIPPGTAPGRRFRIRGQGIAKNDQHGDLIVEVQLTVPERLTEEQERAMREFAAAGGLKY
jgi:molecular chaperone DnaJ